jgi:hypothetical protein
MYNKAQLSKDRRLAKEPKKLARPKDKFVIPGAPKVDPNGYWDPANVDRIIEVPLNEDSRSITMSYPDGTPLDQPLIGVGTDTGMMQYMMPGQDYMFPYDSSVIENPIMDDGEYMDLDDEEIALYREGGYVIEELPQQDNGGVYSKDIQYPAKHNSANSFTVTDPRSMQDGGGYEIELTDEEIDQYRKGGYVVEELPQAAAGMNVRPLPVPPPDKYLDSIAIQNVFKKAEPLRLQYLTTDKKYGKANLNLVNNYVHTILSDPDLQAARSRLSKINREDPLANYMVPINTYDPRNPTWDVTGDFTFKPFRVPPPSPSPSPSPSRTSDPAKPVQSKPEVGKLETKELTQTPEIIPSNYNYTPKKPETIRTASTLQTVMEPDPNREGKFKVKELRQVPYAAYFPGEGWLPMNAPQVMYYNPTTGEETEKRFQDGGPKEDINNLFYNQYLKDINDKTKYPTEESAKLIFDKRNKYYNNYLNRKLKGVPEADNLKIYNQMINCSDGQCDVNLPTYKELDASFDNKIITTPEKVTTEIVNIDNIQKDDSIQSSSYPYRYHRERNPWTQTFEVMSPEQHMMLEREAYKLKNQGLKLTTDNMPVIENRELIDVVTGKPVGTRAWDSGYGFLPQEGDITGDNYKRRGGLAKAQDGLTIADPEEYAFRKAAYDDSLHLYNTYKNLEPKKVGKLRSTKNTWHSPYKTYTATKTFTPTEKKEWENNHGGRSQAFSNYASKLLDAEMEKGNFDLDWPTIINHPIGYKANVGIYNLRNKNTGKDAKNMEIAFRFEKPVQPIYKPSEEPLPKEYKPNLDTDLAAWLKTQKAPTSYADRKKLYEQATGKTDYKGTAEQNIGLLKLLKQEGLDYKMNNQEFPESIELPQESQSIELPTKPVNLIKSDTIKAPSMRLEWFQTPTGTWYQDYIPDQVDYNINTGSYKKLGGLTKAQLGLITSPFNLPADVKHPMQVSPNKPTVKRTGRTYDALTDVKPAVADNTKDVTADQAVFAKQVNDYMASDEYKAEQKAKKDAQAQFEKEQWDRYNKMSLGEKALDRTNAFLNQPLLMAANFVMGDQAYIPGMAEGLGEEGPDYDKWLKATGQERGLGVNDVFNVFNPGNWGGHAGREFGDGNYVQGGLELGLGSLGLKAGLVGNQLAKTSANNLINLEQKAGQASKYLTTQTPLRNAYNYNPLANRTAPTNKLFHGSPNPNLQVDDIILTDVNPNVGPRPGKFKTRAIASGDPLEMPGGFYTNDLAEPFFMGNFPYRYSMDVPANAKVFKWKTGASDNISVKKLQELKNEGYDIIQGKNILGEQEYIPLNKDLISNWKLHQTGADDLKLLENKRFQTAIPHWLRGYPTQLPGSPNAFTRSGLGGMDMSNHTIKNVDYYTQLLDTYNKNIMPAANRKFYKDLIATVKKQDGLVTERQLNELKRLATGNFDFGSKGYNKGYEGGGYVANQMTHFQGGGPKDTIIYPPGDSEYINQPPLNYDILEMLNQKARREYEQYWKDQVDPTNLNRTSPAYQQKVRMKEGLVEAQDGGTNEVSGPYNISGPNVLSDKYLSLDEDVEKFADKYVTSDNYRKMLETQGYPEDKIDWRIQDVLSYGPSLARMTDSGNSQVGWNEETELPYIQYNVYNPHGVSDEEVSSHEWGHLGVSSGFNPLQEYEQEQLVSRQKPGAAQNEHDSDPQENRADLFELRYFLDKEGVYDSSKEEPFTMDHLKKYKSKLNKDQLNRIFRHYNDEDIIWLMNNIAKNEKANTGEYGLKTAQSGGNTDPGNNALELHMFYDKMKFQPGGTFQPDDVYVYKERPGSYYKLGDNNQMLIKNKDTQWQYTPMNDPEGNRRKALEQGLESGLTQNMNPSKATPNSFESNEIYTYKEKPGSYYKLGEDNKLLIKNKGTEGKYVPMVDPEGKRRETLMKGFKSGSTQKYVNTPKSSLNDFFYSKQEALSETARNRAMQCLNDENGNCAGSAFNYYDKYVVPKLPGGKTSWLMKDAAGMASGKEGSNPSYGKAGESWDSWDLAGGFLDAGAKLHYTAADNNNQTLYKSKLKGLTQPEVEQYWRSAKLPIGTIINAGDAGLDEHYGKGKSYNVTKGLAPSNHTAIVVGYDDYGTPYIYDYGAVHSLANSNALVNLMGITNIISPKETLNNTYDKLKANNSFKEEIKPLKINLPAKSMLTDVGEMQPFMNEIEKNKENILNELGLSNKEYDEYAKIATAIAMAETKGGQDLATTRYGVIPSYLTDKLGFGESQGITQINPKSVWNQQERINIEGSEDYQKYFDDPGFQWDPVTDRGYVVKYRNNNMVKKLNTLGVNEFNYDPWNPKHQAIVTMVLIQDNERTSKSNAAKNPLVSKSLTTPELIYYQWNVPSALTTDNYEKAARGDNENVKRFMQHYNFINAANPTNKQKGGSVHRMSDDDIKKYRDAGYIVIEEPDYE